MSEHTHPLEHEVVAAPAAKPSPSSRTLLILAGLVVFVAAIAFFAGRATGIATAESRALEQQAAAEAESSTVFPDALDACDVPPGTTYAALGDNDTTLDIDQKGEDDVLGMPIETYWCILNELGAPDRVKSDMGNTTSMDGRREASWDGITASWSYHPDRGIDTVLYLDD